MIRLILISLILMTTTLSADKPKTYSLGTGEEGAKRLDVQGEFLQEKSAEHLERAGLASGQVVYDVGCGNGYMTLYLAQKVGPKGHVYAVDASQEQLKLAEERIKNAGLNNVTFLQVDVEEAELPCFQKADIVYARLILMHLKKPEAAIQKMATLLKADGTLALQECTSSSCHFPHNEGYLDDLIKALVAVGAHLGVDYDIGDRLKGLVAEAGFKSVDQYEYQPLLDPEFARDYLKMAHGEWGRKTLEFGIASAEEYEKQAMEIDQISTPFAISKGVYITARKG